MRFAWMSAFSNLSRPTACSCVGEGVANEVVDEMLVGACNTSLRETAISLSSFTLASILLISSLFSGCFALRYAPAEDWRSLSAIW